MGLDIAMQVQQRTPQGWQRTQLPEATHRELTQRNPALIAFLALPDNQYGLPCIAAGRGIPEDLLGGKPQPQNDGFIYTWASREELASYDLSQLDGLSKGALVIGEGWQELPLRPSIEGWIRLALSATAHLGEVRFCFTIC